MTSVNYPTTYGLNGPSTTGPTYSHQFDPMQPTRIAKGRITARNAFVYWLALAGVCALSPGGKSEVVRFLSKRTTPPQNGQITSFIDGKHLWVGLSYTEDGGASWIERVPPVEEAEKFINFPSADQPAYFVSQTRGWLSGTDVVWSTSDGGVTWSVLFGGHFHAMGFADKRTGWMGVGDHRTVRNYVTKDFGRTWSKCGDEWQMDTEAPLSSVFLLDDKTGWITMAKYDSLERPVLSGIARTEDGGCTWNTLWLDTENRAEYLGEIHFIDKNFGWLLAAGYGKLRVTSDGGSRWRDVPLPSNSFSIESGHLVDRTHGWILGSFRELNRADSGIFYTSDAGDHWRSITQADLHLNRGLARDIPSAWGDGVLMKRLAVHEKPPRR